MSTNEKKPPIEQHLPDEIRVPLFRALDKILPKVTETPTWVRGRLPNEDEDSMVEFINSFRCMTVTNYCEQYLLKQMDQQSLLSLLEQSRLDNFICLKILKLLNKTKHKLNQI
jgi:hypothetical protein